MAVTNISDPAHIQQQEFPVTVGTDCANQRVLHMSLQMS